MHICLTNKCTHILVNNYEVRCKVSIRTDIVNGNIFKLVTGRDDLVQSLAKISKHDLD